MLADQTGPEAEEGTERLTVFDRDGSRIAHCDSSVNSSTDSCSSCANEKENGQNFESYSQAMLGINSLAIRSLFHTIKVAFFQTIRGIMWVCVTAGRLKNFVDRRVHLLRVELW